MLTKNIVAALPILVCTSISSAECVLQESIVTQHKAEIQERTSVRRDVVSMPDGMRKCIVDFRVRIHNKWYSAFGEYSWDGNRGSHEMCARAVKRAEDSVKERIGSGSSTTERLLICKDRPELNELKSSTIGTVGNNSQFRIHPEYPMRFWHNGAQCRWFLESQFTGKDIAQFQGVVCQVGKDQWVVVDKF